MGQNTKLDLGVIGVNEHAAVLWNKYPPDLPAQLHAHRDILKIGLCTADTSGCSDGLVEFAVDPPILADIGSQPFGIGRI